VSLLKEFTATATQRDFSFRIEKALQHIDVQRISGTSVTRAGLIDGLPEIISAEITHPTRSRVRNANDTPLSHMALWAQHARGPISEAYDGGVGLAEYDTRFKYYLNDNGPVEILADDHFVVKFEGCIVGATYRIYGPEQQVVALEANRYFSYETAVILASDRERNLSAQGKQGIILPNDLSAIERVVLRVADADGNVAETELDLFELMAVQADTNPFTSVLYDLANLDQIRSQQAQGEMLPGSSSGLVRTSVLAPSTYADLFLIMFTGVQSIQIDTVLGHEVKYTIIGLADRV
jgi:hypothetical protein